MENGILVSVILASYNHADYIDQAIQSVLNQGIQNMEVIVVDDGSTDGTPERVEKIKDSRLKLIRLKENRRFHPRNEGLTIAKGKYIAFQNSDDVWKQEKIIKQIEILEKNSQISGCFTMVEIIDENNFTLKKSWANNSFSAQSRSNIEWLRYFFDYGNCLCISSAVVRSEQVKKVGNFNPSLFQLGDLDLWIRLAALGEFHIIEKKFTQMRIVKNKNMSRPSLTTSQRTAMERIDVFERYKENIILDKIDRIFIDIMPNSNNSEVAKLGTLALHAWKLSPAHILFANKIITEIIKDKEKKEELISIFGIKIINEFIKKRGEVKIMFQDRRKTIIFRMIKFFKIFFDKTRI